MTVVLSPSDFERLGMNGTCRHVDDLDDMGYSAVQFSVDSLGPDEDGKGLPGDGMGWGMPADPHGMGGLGTDNAGYKGNELCFDDFLDLESLSNTGDELTDLPDTLLFDVPTVDGTASTTSTSDEVDELLSCHSSQQYSSVQPAQQYQSYHPQSPSKETISSARVGSAATAAASGFPSTQHRLARAQSSTAIGLSGEQRNASTYPEQPLGPAGSQAISDSELLRLEGISLQASPSRVPPQGTVSQSQPPTPLHPHHGQGSPAAQALGAAAATITGASNSTSTTTGGRNILQAFKSKIQKATASRTKSANSARTNPSPTRRTNNNGMSSIAIERPISPLSSPNKGFKLRPDQEQAAMADTSRFPISPPNSATIPQGLTANFSQGMLEDPFGGLPVGQMPGMFRRQTPHTPLDTPVLDEDKNGVYFQQQAGAHGNKASWPSPQQPDTQSQGPIAWANSFAQPDGSLDGAHWWDNNVDMNAANSHFQAQNARNASFNLTVQTQQANAHDVSYEYGEQSMPATATGHEMTGLMIDMPHASHHVRSSSSPALPHGAYTNMAVPHHMPLQQQQQQHYPLPGAQTERRPRMPRAPSAGARHLSTPLRRQRPSSATRGRDSSSASPTPQARSRHSSGSSAAGVGAAGSVMAGSVKKRRSYNSIGGASRASQTRTPSCGSSTGLGLGIELGGGGGGFVNYTPSDKNVLMTGVAPSGSSKTKARREKEAQEKRRKMSEAALRAVRDAGGDIDKLREQGFD